MIKVIIKRPGAEPEVVNFRDNFNTNNISAAIGCDFTDRVILAEDLIMYVDDIGLHKNLPLNLKIQTTSPQFPIQLIVGTVLIARRNIIDDDFHFISVTDSDIALFDELLEKSKIL